MHPRPHRHLRVIAAAAVAAFAMLSPPDAPRAQSAGTLEIRRHTIDAGGGNTAAGTRTVVSTLGQPDAVLTTAGGLQLRGGFWAARAQPTIDDVVFQNGFE